MPVVVPNVLSSGTTIDFADLNENFDALEGGIANISNAEIANSAGISSEKLADRFAVFHDVISLVPCTAGTDLGTLTEFTTPSSDTTLCRHRVTLAAGQEAYLCEVEFYVHDISPGGADNPTLAVQVNSTSIGGGAVTVTSDEAYWRLRNGSPITNPLISLTDGDVISFVFGRTGGGGAPTIAGVWARLTYKIRITA